MPLLRTRALDLEHRDVQVLCTRTYTAGKNSTPSRTVFVGTRYNMCILRGCSASDSIVTIIVD